MIEKETFSYLDLFILGGQQEQSRGCSSCMPDGTVMVVEPFANDRLEDNLTPIGRMLYAASTMICIPTSLSQNGPALAGETGISKVIKAGGFKHF